MTSVQLCSQLTIRVGDRVLLKEADLDAPRGQVTVLVGPSGVGKSVLADVVFGLSPSGAGDPIVVKGTVGKAQERGSLVFQHGGGLGHLTLAQNLLLVRADEAANAELLDGLELAPDRPGVPLSGGESRRLAVARALAAERELLWLDEPAAGLDAALAAELATQLRKHAREFDIALVVTSHQPEFISAVADRVVFFGRDGTLQPLGVEHDEAAAVARAIRERIERSKPATWTAVDEWRPGLEPSSIPRAIAEGLLAVPELLRPGRSPSKRTLLQALRLSAVQGGLFYPFVGAIFAAIFIVVIEMAIVVKPAWDILGSYGPVLVLRFSPAMAGILVAARAGSAMSAWFGQMTVQRQFEALRILNPAAERTLAAPGWLGLAAAGVLATISFGAALTAVFCVYIVVAGHAEEVRTLLGNFELRLSAAAFVKTLAFSALVAGCTMASARQAKRRVDLVASDLTRGIMLSTIGVMLAELLLLLIELVT